VESDGLVRKIVTSLAASLAVATAFVGDVSWHFDAEHVPTSLEVSSKTFASASPVAPEEKATVDLFQANTPSVVYITNVATRRDALSLDLMEVPVGTGSGFVWDKDGRVITNYHVVNGASNVKVTLIDKQAFDAKVIGFDADKDIAVLQLQDIDQGTASKLVPIKLGSSDGLLVGQSVYAIGNPFGLDHTMTSGIISGLGRVIASESGRPIRGAIQTDAAINPGNSGGPLLDRRGQLIGINTAILDPSGRGANAGVGFAIPIDTVKGVVNQIIRYGKIVRPYLGITLAPDSAVYQLGQRGVLVLDVPGGSPAEGQLQPTYRNNFGQLVLGDIIVSLNNKPVKSTADLYRELDDLQVGDTVQLKVLRGLSSNKEVNTVKVGVTLGKRVTKFES